jgi:hypothetical protein
MAADPFANAHRLAEIVGFDAAKGPNVTGDVLKEVLDEILEDRKQKAKVLAKEQLVKALTLREQMAAARRKFETEWEKSDKELGKVVNRLYASLNGKPAPVETEDTPETPAAA